MHGDSMGSDILREFLHARWPKEKSKFIRNTVQGSINMKYLGTLDHSIPKMVLDRAKRGNHVVVEISPKFFSTWDFARMQ
jgi:hypothetical protein